jgi:hypothetical protein
MSRELPAKPSLEYLRKQAKQLQRTTSQGKLADAQYALAREYGFADWAKLKSYAITLGLPTAEALTAAIRDQGAQRVRELLESHPELRAKINEPLPNYGCGATERSGDHRRSVGRRRQHSQTNRVVGRRFRRARRL